MKKIAILLLGLTLAACATKPIYQVSKHPVPVTAQTLSQDQIEEAIILVGSQRGWRFQRAGAGHLVGTYDPRGQFNAVVDVKFDNRSYSITYKDSRNLDYKDGNIHQNYNRWIRNLEEDIDVKLAAMGVLKS